MHLINKNVLQAFKSVADWELEILGLLNKDILSKQMWRFIEFSDLLASN